MTVTQITPNPADEKVEETVRYLDAIQALAELLSIAAEADALTDAIVSDRNRLKYAFDGISLLAFDAQQRLHGF